MVRNKVSANLFVHRKKADTVKEFREAIVFLK
jgi:hypothetical protein